MKPEQLEQQLQQLPLRQPGEGLDQRITDCLDDAPHPFSWAPYRRAASLAACLALGFVLGATMNQKSLTTPVEPIVESHNTESQVVDAVALETKTTDNANRLDITWSEREEVGQIIYTVEGVPVQPIRETHYVRSTVTDPQTGNRVLAIREEPKMLYLPQPIH